MIHGGSCSWHAMWCCAWACVTLQGFSGTRLTEAFDALKRCRVHKLARRFYVLTLDVSRRPQTSSSRRACAAPFRFMNALTRSLALSWIANLFRSTVSRAVARMRRWCERLWCWCRCWSRFWYWSGDYSLLVVVVGVVHCSICHFADTFHRVSIWFLGGRLISCHNMGKLRFLRRGEKIASSAAR